MPNSSDNASYLKVIEEHKGLLYKVANAYCHDEEDRKDLIQEIMIQIWRSFARYDEQYKLTTWLYRISLNVAISWYRKEKSRAKIALPINEDLIYLLEERQSPKIDEDVVLLNGFIAKLPKLDRALILLYLESTPQQEIANILGLSLSNVSTKIGRIKSKLRQMFQSQNLRR